MIDLHYVATANGMKVAIALQEMALDYRVINYDLFAGAHLNARFKQINPNNKLPAIVDHDPTDGGAPFPVFESGAILLYLAEKTGQFLPADSRGRSVTLQWLFWQMAGLGPMHGQAHHFLRYAPERFDYPSKRYANEALRLLKVLDYRLAQAEYLAGDEYSIADMAVWPWVGGAALIDIDIAELPALSRWVEQVGERPAVQAAVEGKQTAVPGEYTQKHAVLTPEQWSNMFGENLLAASDIR
ncbi:MAG: glutathione S-transferase C-terminal domain-containing protein [Novosphingobium sp.]